MKTAAIKARAPAVGMNGHVGGGFRVFMNEGQLHVPGWVTDIESFRRWTDTDEFPEQGNIWWLRGEVWADMSKEQVFTHLGVKQEFFRVLGNLAKTEAPGDLIPDGLLLCNFEADISGNPDATFISSATMNSDRVRLIEGKAGGYVEIQGSPDMVLEVISGSSSKKDLVILMEAYWKAGIREYWIVDARKDPPRFDIHGRTPKGFKATPKKHGWMTSRVFGKLFQLSVGTNASGNPSYTLEVR